MKKPSSRPETLSVHAGNRPDPLVGGVTTPIHTSSSYRYPNPSGQGTPYPRYGSIPTQRAAAEKIAALEGAEEAIVTASGMGAISTCLISLLSPGDHILLQADLYGGTHHFVTHTLARMGVEYDMTTGTETADLARAMKPNTKVLYLETPTNPLLAILDLKEAAEVAHAGGALAVCDNTFASPINQTPLALGFDLVVHSGTKYLNGHSDLNCGAVAGSRELVARAHQTSLDLGPTLNVYDAYLLERGMKTLAVRMARHNENAMAVAKWLKEHKKVSRVNYPGLPDHPGHDIAAKQMRGFSGMLSFTLDADVEEAHAAVARLGLITSAVSLGGVESLICFPAETSHEKMTRDERLAVGVTDTLIRLSVGIEAAEDIIADLDQALDF